MRFVKITMDSRYIQPLHSPFRGEVNPTLPYNDIARGESGVHY